MVEAIEKSKNSIKDRVIVAILQDEKSSARDKGIAFNRLYSRHERQLSFFFLKSVKDSDVAEDLKMITFEKAYANIAKYDEKYAFSTWIYNIAKNNLIDHSRKSKLKLLSIDELSVDKDSGRLPIQIKSDALNPEEEMTREHRIKQVQLAIASIDDRILKQIINLRFIEELSFKQISEKMRIDNSSTLRVSAKRGKEILKRKLSDVNPFA